MKRILTALITLFISITSFAQLHSIPIEQLAGYKTIYNIENKLDEYTGTIRYTTSDGYVLMGVTTNVFEMRMATIYLGATKEEAIKSIQEISILPKVLKEYGAILVIGAHGAGTYIFETDGVICISTENIYGVSAVLMTVLKKQKEIIKAITNTNIKTIGNEYL